METFDNTKKFINYIPIVGIPLNFIGEYFQVLLVYPIIMLPRYAEGLFAVICDILLILFIHFLMKKVYKDKLWASQWNGTKVFIVVLLGMVLVVLGEKVALGIGLWSYTSSMPVVPIIKVGITPILQLGLTPLITLYIASRIAFKKNASRVVI